MIKAIETVYDGCRFRSRTEARFATFFNALGLPWEYEKEGYEIDGERYLPDFWMSTLDCWVEIKGQQPNDSECSKAFNLARASQKNTFILWGEFRPFKMEPIPESLYPRYRGVLGHGFLVEENNVRWSDTFYMFGECTRCHMVGIWFHGESGISGTKSCLCGDDHCSSGDTPLLVAAYTAARQARFEHR